MMPRETKYRATLAKVIDSFSFEVIAEIGVYQGGLTGYLLDNCRSIKEYYGVDPWKDYYMGETNRVIKWQKVFSTASLLLSKHKQLTLLKMESVDAAEKFPDYYFDMVFIDGDHCYEAVKKDILVWKSKVKPEGILCGHDYCSGKPGVVKAVNELIGVGTAKRGVGLLWFAKDINNYIPMRETYNYEI